MPPLVPRPAAGVGRAIVGRAAPQRRWVALGVVLALLIYGVAAVVLFPSDSFMHEFVVRDHIGQLCLLALSEFISPLHHLFELVVGIGLLWGLTDRALAWRQARRLLSGLDYSALEPGSDLHRAAIGAGVDPTRVSSIPDSPLPAFTLGAFRPRIFVSDRLHLVLSYDELVAVLAHEAEHERRRDPLRLSVMRFVSRMLFWLPAVRSLEAYLTEEAELRADAAAARRSGLATASALLALIRSFGRSSMPTLSAGVSPHDFISLRIRLLTGQDSAAHTRVSGLSLLGTVGALALLYAAAAAELHESTHSSHVVTGEAECREDASHPLRQFICEGTSPSTASPQVALAAQR